MIFPGDGHFASPSVQYNTLRVPAALFAGSAASATIIAVPVLIYQTRYFSGADVMYAFCAVASAWFIAFAVSLLHSVILGLPAYLLAIRFHFTFWWVFIVFGFMIGLLPSAMLLWPPEYMVYSDRFWDGKQMVALLIHGAPNRTVWISYIFRLCVTGVSGMLGGFVAWLVWRFAPTYSGSKSF